MSTLTLDRIAHRSVSAASILIKQGSSVAQSLINGSLFYALPQTTNGIFTRGGTLFFILLFNALLSMTEVTVSFEGRAILAKHKVRRVASARFASLFADFALPPLLFDTSPSRCTVLEPSYSLKFSPTSPSSSLKSPCS